MSQQRTPETNSYPKTKKANQEFFLSFFLTWLHTLVAQAIHVGSSVGSLRGSMENRTPLKARVHSPAPCLLTPNDDDRERAQVRLARAAALRRKSGLAPDVEERLSTMRQQESNVLSKERILELHNNCIKLAAENVRLASTGVLFSTLFSAFCFSLCVCGCYIFFVHSSGDNELVKGEKRTERDDVGYCSHIFCSCGWREL